MLNRPPASDAKAGLHRTRLKGLPLHLVSSHVMLVWTT